MKSRVPQEVPGVRIYGSRIELKLQSIALGFELEWNSNWKAMPFDWTWISLELEGHALGLNSNITQVSSSLGSLYRSNFIFGCKRVNFSGHPKGLK